jgi:hypothetical protein
VDPQKRAFNRVGNFYQSAENQTKRKGAGITRCQRLFCAHVVAMARQGACYAYAPGTLCKAAGYTLQSRGQGLQA